MKPTFVWPAILLLACTNLNAQSVSPAARKAVQTIQKPRAIDAPNSRVLPHLPLGAVVRTELSLTLHGRNARVCFGNVLLARSTFFAIAVARV
jgi:hypothetical protein